MSTITILVADENEEARQLAASNLQMTGRVGLVDEAETAEQVIDMVAKKNYDMIFCDAQLYTASGVQVMAALKELRGKPMPFVVFMSDNITPEMYVEAEALGAFEFLNKPFDEDQILNFLDLHRRMKTPSHVLVVDDSPTIRRLIGKIFEHSAFAVIFEEADSGKAAMERIQTKKYDAIFMDVNMPVMNGIHTYALMKSRFPNLKIILMSAETKEQVKERAGSLRMDGYLRKPFRPNDVDSALCFLYGIKAPRLPAKAAASSALLAETAG